MRTMSSKSPVAVLTTLPPINQTIGEYRMASQNSTTGFRGVTFRLYPGTKSRHIKLSQTAGACRYVWNHFLAENKRKYRLSQNVFVRGLPQYRRPTVTFQGLFVQFTELRNRTPWLKDLPFKPVRYVLKYQADAWKQAFKHGGFPKFHGRRGQDSFTIPEAVKLKAGKIHIPRTGWCTLSRKGGNPYDGCQPVKAVIKRDCGRWYCVVTYAADIPATADNGLALGVDMNVRQVAVSTGDILHMPDVKKLETRKKRYQRRMARQVKGSNRRALTRQRVAKTSRRIAHARHNWAHQTSRQIADTAGMVVVEDLQTKGMTASAKGSIESPGKNVRQKAGLNREILTTGWSQLRQMLEYKAAHVVAVNPAYTSQTCNSCKAVDKDSRKKQAVFKCVHCGHADNADVNASRNIMASGIGASGRRGALTLVTPETRQNTTVRVAA